MKLPNAQKSTRSLNPQKSTRNPAHLERAKINTFTDNSSNRTLALDKKTA